MAMADSEGKGKATLAQIMAKESIATVIYLLSMSALH